MITDIHTEFMAEWLWRCCVECNEAGLKTTAASYALRLKAVLNHPRYRKREAA